MTTRPIPIRMPETLLELVDQYSREQRTDRSVILRQWIYQAAEAYAVRLVSESRMSIGRAAELLDLTHWDIMRIAQEQGVEIGATAEQYRKGQEYVGRLVRKK